ncbi:MAG: hypothetical protein ACRDGG_00180, partial [Anaerolineae bacterium]
LETAKLALEAAVRQGILLPEEVDTGMGYSITSYSLNEEHAKVRAALRLAGEVNHQPPATGPTNGEQT